VRFGLVTSEHQQNSRVEPFSHLVKLECSDSQLFFMKSRLELFIKSIGTFKPIPSEAMPQTNLGMRKKVAKGKNKALVD